MRFFLAFLLILTVQAKSRKKAPKPTYQFWCQGTVNKAALYSDGWLQVQGSFHEDWISLCFLYYNQYDNKYLDPVCDNWTKIIMSAAENNYKISMRFTVE